MSPRNSPGISSREVFKSFRKGYFRFFRSLYGNSSRCWTFYKESQIVRKWNSQKISYKLLWKYWNFSFTLTSVPVRGVLSFFPRDCFNNFIEHFLAFLPKNLSKIFPTSSTNSSKSTCLKPFLYSEIHSF